MTSEEIREQIVEEAIKMRTWYIRWRNVQNQVPSSTAPKEQQISTKRLKMLQEKRNIASDRFVAARETLFKLIKELETQ